MAETVPLRPSPREAPLPRRQVSEPPERGSVDEVLEDLDEFLDEVDALLEEQSVLVNYRQRSGQ